MSRGSERLADSDKVLRREGWRLLRDSLRPQWRWLIFSVFAALLWTCAKLAVPLLVGAAVDQGIVPGDTGEILKYTGLIVFVGLLQGTGMGMRRYGALRMSYRVETNLRARLFAHLQLLHFAYHDEAQTGQLMAHANTDLYQISQWLSLGPISLSSLFILIGVVIVMLLSSPVLALLALGALPLLNVMATRFSRRLAPVGLEQQEKLGDLSAVVEETVAGIRAVKGFGAEQLEVDRLDVEANAVLERSLVAARLRAGFLPALDFLPALSLAAILWYGGHQVLDGNLEVGDLVAFNLYIVMLILPLRLTGQLIAQAARATGAAGRIYEVLSTDPLITDPPRSTPLPVDGKGELRFEGVDFRYGDGPPVLVGLDLVLRPGEAVALVGPTASGKTTVARLIPRFYDVSDGRVLLDGVDVRALELSAIRSAVGIVFEDTFLFSDSVRENIAFANPEAHLDQVRRAAALSGAADFIESLPDGYETVIGEHGYSLSGGQRQRIAIARAVLADPRVLILDDATSSVDPTKEHEIRAALREVMAGRTTIIIAHRPATIALADRVVLLDHGRAVEEGTHEELLERSVLYRSVLAQSTHADDVAAEAALAAAVAATAAAGDAETEAESEVGAGTVERSARLMGWSNSAIADEDKLHKGEGQQVARRVWRMLRPFRGRIVLATLCVVGQVACLLAGPALVKHGIDAGITAGDVGALNLSAALYVVVAVAALILGRGAIILMARIGETFLRDLRARVFRHLLDLGLDFFEREQTGRLVARMTSDIDALQELVQSGLTAMTMNALMFFGAVIVIFVLSWQLALCTLIVVPPAFFATRWFRRESNRAYLDVRERIGTNLATLQEGLAGVRVVQAFGREQAFTGRFRGTNEAQYEANMETIRIATRYFPFMETLGIVATAIIIGLGGFFADQGIVSVGTVAAFVLYLNSLFEPVQQLSQQYNIVQQSGAALNKLFGLLDEKPTIFERPGAVDLPANGAIEVSGLSFGYGSGRDVLQGVNLVIAPGERLALVGPTGAGKSTLAKLIVRFYDPRQGAVKMGDIDLRDATTASLRRRIVVVPQEGFLFTGTVRDNVRVGRPDATDEEVEAAIAALGVAERFAALPMGLDTEVRERGSRLSGGERQLVSLARAALADPTILVLDEATSSLDPGTERVVELALDRLTENRTVVVVAHRLSTAARADRVGVVDDGMLAELGTHEELIRREGRYAALFASWTAASNSTAT